MLLSGFRDSYQNKEYSFLNYIVLIPLISTLMFMVFSISVYTYFNFRDGEVFVNNIEKRLISDKKNSIKDRVDFIIGCIKSKQKDLKKRIESGKYTKSEIEKFYKEAKKGIIETINNFHFDNNGYVFIYKVLNFNGGDRFAVMIANPNRKDLIGKYVSDNYKDEKGFMFRKAFLNIIKKKGEAFVKYYYKKPGSNRVSPKISYFKLEKNWKWVVASGIYLDDIYKESNAKKEQIIANIKKNNLLIFYISLVVLLFSLIFSYTVYKFVKIRFFRYQDYIKKQRRALFLSNRVLKQQLYRDYLTKLKNRKILLQNLEKKNFYALIILDIDDFKIINELYGSRLGNEVLVQLTEIIKNFIKIHGYRISPYRLGSDEFVLLVKKEMKFKEFDKLISKLYGTILSHNFKLFENIYININVTMGISFSKRDTLSKADIALNYAKKNDKMYAIYSQSIDNRVDIDKNIQIKKELLLAVKEDRVEPFFQPICDREKRVVKYEALMRIVYEDRILMPNEFLQIAKRLKLFPKLSKIMFKKSFDRFKDSDKLFSINISLNDMVNVETVKFIENVLEQDRDTAKRLIIEILESEGIEDFEVTKSFMQKVRKMGVKIAIDDFGSGYSSFKYILELRPDIIKIDGSLISNIATNKENYIMVKNIVNMAKDLNITTVAEFVSSEEIFVTLKKLGVDEYQGYFIGKPKREI